MKKIFLFVLISTGVCAQTYLITAPSTTANPSMWIRPSANHPAYAKNGIIYNDSLINGLTEYSPGSVHWGHTFAGDGGIRGSTLTYSAGSRSDGFWFGTSSAHNLNFFTNGNGGGTPCLSIITQTDLSTRIGINPQSNTVSATFYIDGGSGTNILQVNNSAETATYLTVAASGGVTSISLLKVNGPANLGAGLNVSGTTSLTGLTNTGTFSTSSTTTLNGLVDSGTMNVAGSSTLSGTVHTSTISVSGQSNLTGISNSGTLSSSGAATITGGTQLSSTVNVGSGVFGTTGLNQFRVTTGTGTVDIGQYTSGRGAIWVNQNTPSATNFAISGDATGNLFLNTVGQAVDILSSGNIVSSFASATSYFSGKLRIGSTVAPVANLDITGTESVSAQLNTNGIANSTTLTCSGASTLTGNVQLGGHIIGSSVAPTFTVGAGAGSGATATLSPNSTDIAGTVSVTTAGVPSGGAVIITLTFNGVYGAAPNPSPPAPRNATTAALSGLTMVYANTTTTLFTINSGTTGLATGTVYVWTYHLIQ